MPSSQSASIPLEVPGPGHHSTSERTGILHRLAEEHRRSSSLLAQLAEVTGAGSEGERAAERTLPLVAALRREIVAQAYAEEMSLFRVFEQTALRRSAYRLAAEHVGLAVLLEKLTSQWVGSSGWNRTLENLAVALHEHYRQEESDLFEAARELLSADQLLAVDELYVELKEQALGRRQ